MERSPAPALPSSPTCTRNQEGQGGGCVSKKKDHHMACWRKEGSGWSEGLGGGAMHRLQKQVGSKCELKPCLIHRFVSPCCS